MSLTTYAAALDAVRGIGWPALRRVRSALPGPHASIVRGTTAEFVEYRPYRQGDDPKKIDWKLVARADRVYVRVSQERTILPTMMVVDASGSMAFPRDSNAKWELARRLAIGLTAVARHRGDPVGLIVTHAAGTAVIEPRTRRTVLEEMMAALDTAPDGTVSFADAAAEAIRLGARIVLLSDFLGEEPELLERAKTAAAAGREIYAIHIVAAAELDPDPKQRLVADPEQPALRRPMPPHARAVYMRRFEEWRTRLAHDWRTAGAVYTMAVPDSEPFRRTVRRITTAGETGRGSFA